MRTRPGVCIDVAERPVEPHVDAVILAAIFLRRVLQDPCPNSVLDIRLRLLSATMRAVHPHAHGVFSWMQCTTMNDALSDRIRRARIAAYGESHRADGRRCPATGCRRIAQPPSPAPQPAV